MELHPVNQSNSGKMGFESSLTVPPQQIAERGVEVRESKLKLFVDEPLGIDVSAIQRQLSGPVTLLSSALRRRDLLCWSQLLRRVAELYSFFFGLPRPRNV